MRCPTRSALFVGLILCAGGLAACGDDGPGDTGAAGTDQGADSSAPDASGADDPGDATSPAADTSAEVDDASPGADAGPVGPPFCEGGTHQVYDPTSGATVGTLPDDWYTTDDPDSPTGVRIGLDPEQLGWLAAHNESIQSAFLGLDGLDGWGISAPVFVRFDGPIGEVPDGEQASLSSDAIMLVELTDDAAVRVPFESQVVEEKEGTTLLLWPMVPMKAQSRYGMVVTTAASDVDGGCLSPSPTTRALLTGDVGGDPALERLVPRYAELLEATGLAPEAVSAATVFTTITTTDLSRAVAADVRTRELHWISDASCGPANGMTKCDRTFESWDYRDDGVMMDADPEAPWEIVVSAWLPSEGEGPWPTLLVGHGINSSRGHAGSVAQHLGDLGIAVIAADAIKHGDHPTAEGIESSYLGVVEFLGIDVDGLKVHSQVLRDNFRQTTYDRLQLLQLVTADPDVDGDGQADLDLSRLGYVGISLGAIMGSEILSLEDRFQAAALLTAGARLTSVFTHSTNLGILQDVLSDLAGSEGGMWRAIAAVQAGADPGDPVSYAPHVLRDRFAGAAPHVLVTMALGDPTVPNITTRSLARALGIPVIAPVVQDVGIVPTEVDLPVLQNLDDGATTAGLFQFDRVSGGDGVVAADHDNTPFSVESVHQLRHFFTTWLEGGSAEIVDPYEVLGTPPLP